MLAELLGKITGIKTGIAVLKIGWKAGLKLRIISRLRFYLSAQRLSVGNLIEEYTSFRGMFHRLSTAYPDSDLIKYPEESRAGVKLEPSATDSQREQYQLENDTKSKYESYKNALFKVSEEFKWPEETRHELYATTSPLAEDSYNQHIGLLRRIASSPWNWNSDNMLLAIERDINKRKELPPRT